MSSDYSPDPDILERIESLQNQGPIPDHVALIMDGNGRWAQHNDLSIPEGHREGVRSTKVIADLCGEIEEVDVLTLYAFSTENWKRPDYEIQALMELLKEWLRREVDRMQEQNVRFETIGQPDKFSDDVVEEINRVKRKTKGNDEYVLNLALNYGGRDEIVRASQALASDVRNDSLEPDEIDEDKFEEYLDTSHLPDPDLLIRTSGEKRLSNYLLWQTAYAEVYFTDILWPDFREDEFLDALFEYQTRDRRFGERETMV